jgi:predicted ATPase
MAIEELHVSGYRSIRDLELRLGRVNVLAGPNGCGKTNLYRSVYLLTAAAHGRLAITLAEEGGVPSVLWAGKRRKEPVRMTLAVRLDRLRFALSCGVVTPTPGGSMFDLDPEIKEENIWFEEGRRVPLLERGSSSTWARDAEGRRIAYPMALSESESVLAQLREPHRFPQISALREEVMGWRFYHQFRSDADSPLRQPQVGSRTPVLSHDGRDLAAALQTIREIGDGPALDEAVDAAFPGAKLEIETHQAYFHLFLRMRGFQRPFETRELSDGTLRYLCLLAALLSPRPPTLLALNEPETSIHPDLLEPLARLVVRASRDSQVWVTTHSQELAGHIERLAGARPVQLEKVDGETRIVDRRPID